MGTEAEAETGIKKIKQNQDQNIDIGRAKNKTGWAEIEKACGTL